MGDGSYNGTSERCRTQSLATDAGAAGRMGKGYTLLNVSGM